MLPTLAVTGRSLDRIVFLGTPSVAAQVLDSLLDASQAAAFEVVAVVTQPPAVRGRGRRVSPSPVAQVALDRGFPANCIFSPLKAGEDEFLEHLKALSPALCVTAAYGNILPQRFLDIPKRGTVNVHPSLLPLYRGAAPVQRAIQDGATVTGVTLAYTVRALDSGPIIAAESIQVHPDIKAPELQSSLFGIGASLLLKELPKLLDGSAAEHAMEQDHSRATHAPKISTEEGWLCFEEPASTLHNKVRAFVEWPGTKARFTVVGSGLTMDVKVVTTRLGGETRSNNLVVLNGQSLLVECGAQSSLEILEVQPQGKKVMSGRDFWNGLQGRQLRVK